mmetsp:Transcript_94335/g.281514  ORF Transcript_94335/g.281514 Transcript_94335/m.281514 type:complete len:92 (+) Transcript_94335:556-831(+)
MRELRAESGTLTGPALTDLGALALSEPDAIDVCPLFIVGGVVLWVSGSCLVPMIPQGALGMVVVPSWGMVPYVGGLLPPLGSLVIAGTPAF